MTGSKLIEEITKLAEEVCKNKNKPINPNVVILSQSHYNTLRDYFSCCSRGATIAGISEVETIETSYGSLKVIEGRFHYMIELESPLVAYTYEDKQK